MLAIIIPYYKHKFFEATLQSLANQTDKSFKVYIGDDASTENPAALLEKFKGKFDFIYQRFENNLGSTSLTKQWERCISLSKNEEWIIVLGDDDVLGNNVVEEFYLFLSKNVRYKTDLIRFQLQVIDDNNQIILSKKTLPVFESSMELLMKILNGMEVITASEFIFSKRVYKENNGFVEFPLGWFSDYATWLLFGKKNGIYSINTEVISWRLSKLNISSKSLEYCQLKSKVKSLFLFVVFIQKEFKIEKTQQNKYMLLYLNNILEGSKYFQIFAIILNNIYLKNTFFVMVPFKFIKNKLKHKIYGSIYSTFKR